MPKVLPSGKKNLLDKDRGLVTSGSLLNQAKIFLVVVPAEYVDNPNKNKSPIIIAIETTNEVIINHFSTFYRSIFAL